MGSEAEFVPVFSVHHATTYRYRQPVAFGEHRFMFRPRDGHDQRLLEADLTIDPQPAGLRWTRDVLGNSVGVARFSGRASDLRFESMIRVETSPSHPNGFSIEDRARTYPFAFSADEQRDLSGWIERGHADPDRAVDTWTRQFLREDRPTPTLELLTSITHAVRRGFSYVRRTERGVQEPAETLQARRGTCRDFTVLMMEAVRSLGLPARFVSGYLYVPSRDRQGLHGGGSTHAWLQVFLPGAGWIDFDPTNAIVGNDGLIRVAVAREPHQALPLSGTYTGFASDELGMEVSVRVTSDRAAEDERLHSGKIA